jgi:hypothetical protein
LPDGSIILNAAFSSITCSAGMPHWVSSSTIARRRSRHERHPPPGESPSPAQDQDIEPGCTHLAGPAADAGGVGHRQEPGCVGVHDRAGHDVHERPAKGVGPGSKGGGCDHLRPRCPALIHFSKVAVHGWRAAGESLHHHHGIGHADLKLIETRTVTSPSSVCGSRDLRTFQLRYKR